MAFSTLAKQEAAYALTTMGFGINHTLENLKSSKPDVCLDAIRKRILKNGRYESKAIYTILVRNIARNFSSPLPDKRFESLSRFLNIHDRQNTKV